MKSCRRRRRKEKFPKIGQVIFYKNYEAPDDRLRIVVAIRSRAVNCSAANPVVWMRKIRRTAYNECRFAVVWGRLSDFTKSSPYYKKASAKEAAEFLGRAQKALEPKYGKEWRQALLSSEEKEI